MENVALYITNCCPLKVKLSCTFPTRVMVDDVPLGQLRTVKKWKELTDGIIRRFFSASRKELWTLVPNKEISWGKVSNLASFNSQLPLLHNDNRLVSLEPIKQRSNYWERYSNTAYCDMLRGRLNWNTHCQATDTNYVSADTTSLATATIGVLLQLSNGAHILATNRATIDNSGSPRLHKQGRIELLQQSGRSSREYDLIRNSSSRKILRSGLRQLGTDEEPEEVVGSCDVIRSVISDCNSAWCNVQ
jgi:hypothetical protein